MGETGLLGRGLSNKLFACQQRNATMENLRKNYLQFTFAVTLQILNY